jgi:hypothetical protein
MEPRKPTFIIVGSAKCGTTALASILDAHSDCCMSRPKEVRFFSDTINYLPNNPNYEKGWAWYQQAFSHYQGESAIGEATPFYSSRTRSPNTARRIYEFNPDMKIIYMVRDPIRRQISAWKMQYDTGLHKVEKLNREHDWALKGIDYWMEQQRDSGQWDECRYGYQLAAYEQYFTQQNILVTFLEDWIETKQEEVERILNFLNLSPERALERHRENSNAEKNRKYDRPLLKKVRTNPVVRSLVKTFPVSFRDWARDNVARQKSLYPSDVICEKICREFIEYIEDDIAAFLTRYHKPSSLWQTTTSHFLESSSVVSYLANSI